MVSRSATPRPAPSQFHPAGVDSHPAGDDSVPQDPGPAARRRSQSPAEDARGCQHQAIKLAAVATDVLGLSGRAMFAALLDGEQDPDVLANLARGRLRAKLPELRQALEGRVQPHHLMLIGQILAHIDALDETIPGIKAVAAAAILAEIGPDMSRFPSAGHLASWAGLCPSNKESAGKEPSKSKLTGSERRAEMGECTMWRASGRSLRRWARIWMSDGVGCGQPPKRWCSDAAGSRRWRMPPGCSAPPFASACANSRPVQRRARRPKRLLRIACSGCAHQEADASR